MTCNSVQRNLSLYLYEELDFASEEMLEQHLEGCSACQLALIREKSWHSQLQATNNGLPGPLLGLARKELFAAVASDRRGKFTWLTGVRFAKWNWSHQLALASFFLFVGAAGSRFMPAVTPRLSQMSLLGGAPAHVRDIQTQQDGRVRIVLDRVQQQELIGSADQSDIRHWLLISARNSADPGLRVDSVELLTAQGGEDVRDALIEAAQHDANAAVRLRAVNSLRRFSSDMPVRRALTAVLRNEANPAIRSAAIDVLLPANAHVEVGPDLLTILTELSRGSEDNDYIRVRSAQILQSVSHIASGDVY